MQKSKYGDNILNVSELIDLLKKQPQNALVYHEGCDCIGSADGVEYNKSDNTVMITRSN